MWLTVKIRSDCSLIIEVLGESTDFRVAVLQNIPLRHHERRAALLVQVFTYRRLLAKLPLFLWPFLRVPLDSEKHLHLDL